MSAGLGNYSEVPALPGSTGSPSPPHVNLGPSLSFELADYIQHPLTILGNLPKAYLE